MYSYPATTKKKINMPLYDLVFQNILSSRHPYLHRNSTNSLFLDLSIIPALVHLVDHQVVLGFA